MDLKLSGRKALITGGSRGIGFACARLLASEGVEVALVGRDTKSLERAAEEIGRQGGPTAVALAADLRESAEVDKAAAAALDKLGRIDILVNSAGDAQGGVFWELSDEDWIRSLELKFYATIRMMRAVIPAMRGRGYGRIVNIVGAAGRQPEAGFLPVAAANAALLAVTKGLADEVGKDGIVVTAVNPGLTRTDRYRRRLERKSAQSGRDLAAVTTEFETEAKARTPLCRIGEAEDVAAWVAFLASDRASHFTGQSITVDGGTNRVPG